MASGSSSNSEKEMARFADAKLLEFHDEFREHVKLCADKFAEDDKRYTQLLDVQVKNTESITELIKIQTGLVETQTVLVEETREIIQLHKDMKGVVRLGSRVQSFGLWLMKWPLIGAGVYSVGNWILKQFS